MSKQYTFRGYKNFGMFCRLNLDKLFPDGDEASIEVVKNQVDLFIKAMANTSGGCPCNANKRRKTAHKVYQETVATVLASDKAKKRISELLNGASEVTFLSGKEDGNPSPPSANKEKPIGVISIILEQEGLITPTDTRQPPLENTEPDSKE